MNWLPVRLSGTLVTRKRGFENPIKNTNVIIVGIYLREHLDRTVAYDYLFIIDGEIRSLEEHSDTYEQMRNIG